MWLAERTLPGRRALWIVITVGSLLCAASGLWLGPGATLAVIVIQFIFAYLLKFWVAVLAPQFLNASRQSGALELLLCTPLQPQQLVRGQVDALTGYTAGPAIVLCAAFPLAAVVGAVVGANEEALAVMATVPIGFLWFLFFLMDIYALAYTGLWFGLTISRIEKAVGRVLLCVVFLPWLTLPVPLLGLIGFIAWPPFWGSWASRRLDTRFREEVASQFEAKDADESWLPWRRKRQDQQTAACS